VVDLARAADQNSLVTLLKEIKVRSLCDGMDAMEVGRARNGVISIAVSLSVALGQRHLRKLRDSGM
jgi:hypothetical protein